MQPSKKLHPHHWLIRSQSLFNGGADSTCTCRTRLVLSESTRRHTCSMRHFGRCTCCKRSCTCCCHNFPPRRCSNYSCRRRLSLTGSTHMRTWLPRCRGRNNRCQSSCIGWRRTGRRPCRHSTCTCHCHQQLSQSTQMRTWLSGPRGRHNWHNCNSCWSMIPRSRCSTCNSRWHLFLSESSHYCTWLLGRCQRNNRRQCCCTGWRHRFLRPVRRKHRRVSTAQLASKERDWMRGVRCRVGEQRRTAERRWQGVLQHASPSRAMAFAEQEAPAMAMAMPRAARRPCSP